MDPINPWLDPHEVRRLAERLLKPARDPAVTCAEAGFDEAFEGFAGVRPANPPLPPAPQAVPAPEAARTSVFIAIPENAPPVPQPPPAPTPTPPPPAAAAEPEPPHFPEPAPLDSPPDHRRTPQPTPPESPAVDGPDDSRGVRGPFLDRIHRFRDWMRHHFSSSGLFILDREGAVIFDESNHGRLHFLARSLAQASRRPGTVGANVHVKIGAGATLEVIPVDTPYGCLVLGAVVPEALSPEAVAAVIEALHQVAAPPR